MKRRMIFLFKFLPVLAIVILAIIIFWPGSAEALNPNHGNCSICHGIHGSPGQSLTSAAAVEVLCLSCHGPAGAATKKAEVHKNKPSSSYPPFSIKCTTCHDPHDSRRNWLGSTNIKQVGKNIPGSLDARISTPNSGVRDVAFVSRGTNAGGPSVHSFADNDQDVNTVYDGICEVCHTLATTHRNNSGGIHTHFTGATCTICHKHENFFLGGGGCTICHNAPQDNGDNIPVGGRRAVNSEFGYTSHHASFNDDDCQVCHEMSQHQKGYLRFKNVDTQAAIALSGDPFTISAEAAKLIEFCIACHDSNAAAGSLPFSDGKTPPVIKATLWNLARHKINNYSCFGNGQTTGCHSSGHGSRRRKFLSPYNTAPAPGEEEERFCTSCHDGTPGSNINGQIAKAYNHPVSSYLNVHNSDEAILIPMATRHVECMDCHDPHYATSANPLKEVTGIDISGTPVGPGTANYRDISEYESCLKCHGDTYNASRSRTTNKRTDFNTANSSFHPVAGRGRNTSNAMTQQLLGGLTTTSVIRCTDCHNNEATSNVNGPAVGSTATPKGPHGSIRNFLLRALYWTNSTAPASWNRTNYALCFLCHNPAAYDGGSGRPTNFSNSGDNFHDYHCRAKASSNIQCANCHYNVHSNQNLATTTWRINNVNYNTPPAAFKTRGVSFSPEITGTTYARATWVLTTSTRNRYCLLRCHGTTHDSGKGYTPSASMDSDM